MAPLPTTRTWSMGGSRLATRRKTPMRRSMVSVQRRTRRCVMRGSGVPIGASRWSRASMVTTANTMMVIMAVSSMRARA